MKTIRLIIKETLQPPIDSPHTTKFHTIDVECEELEKMFEMSDSGHQLTFNVIGAELLKTK